MGSILSVNQMPDALRNRITINEFPGGHMFYTREDSRAAFRQAVKSHLFSNQ
jgi:carboxypeptidase C (cathepsin A)